MAEEEKKKEFAVVSVMICTDQVVLSLRDGDSCGGFPPCDAKIAKGDWIESDGVVSFEGQEVQIQDGLEGIAEIYIIGGRVRQNRGRITTMVP